MAQVYGVADPQLGPQRLALFGGDCGWKRAEVQPLFLSGLIVLTLFRSDFVRNLHPGLLSRETAAGFFKVFVPQTWEGLHVRYKFGHECCVFEECFDFFGGHGSGKLPVGT